MRAKTFTRIGGKILKLKKRAMKVLKVWRIITGFLFFLIILPTFLAANDSELFFVIVLSLTAIIGGLAMIIKQPLKKKYRDYVNSGLLFLVVGAGLVSIEAILAPSLPNFINIIILTLSALCYALGIHRLGLNFFLVPI